MSGVLRHLRRAALLSGGDGLTDAQLLEAFLTRRDEGAFEVLVRRHGRLVMGVCRRLLGHEEDAEDAFQATFLVLARRAGSVRSRQVLASWLYGVAYRTAMKARAMNARRRTKEKQARALPGRNAPRDAADEELLQHLDRELNRLPDRYRVAVILCDLQGKTRREAAGQLKVPEGTLSSRLAQARKLLARRLARYGPALPGGALAALLAGDAAQACVPKALVTGVGRAAALVAAGRASAAGAVSTQVVALTEGVVRAMLLSKLKVLWAVVVVLSVGAGFVGLAYRALAQPGPTAAEPVAGPRGSGVQNPGRLAPDDLDALRLEIEALRKEVRAMGERMKALEARVGGQPAPLPKRFGGGLQPSPNSMRPEVGPGGLRGELPRNPDGPAAGPNPQWGDDPVAEAEAAFKKLQRDPNDQAAARALQRALQQLKERQRPAGYTGPPKKISAGGRANVWPGLMSC